MSINQSTKINRSSGSVFFFFFFFFLFFFFFPPLFLAYPECQCVLFSNPNIKIVHRENQTLAYLWLDTGEKHPRMGPKWHTSHLRLPTIDSIIRIHTLKSARTLKNRLN